MAVKSLRLMPVGSAWLILGCAIQVLESESHPVAGVDYGRVPTDYDWMVEQHIKLEYELEIGSYGKEWMGPFAGSLQRPRDGELETVYGYEVHVLFTNDVHYMVLIRDGKVVGSEDCGELSGGFGLLSFDRPLC